MSSQRQIKREVIAKGKTTPPEWISIGVIVVVIVIGILIVWIYYLPKLFGGSSVDVPTPPGGAPTCPTSPAPVNLMTAQFDLARPNIEVSWNPVLTATTSGETVLGYNIYLSQSANITEANKTLTAFTPVPLKRIYGLQADTTYYWKVATVDSCGTGVISTETGSFTPV